MLNPIKHLQLLFLFTAFCISATLNAQENISYTYTQGFKFIEKAESNIMDGNYAEADKLLEKALQADYGFCGNAWASAHGRINNLKATSLIEQGKAMDALAILEEVNGCNLGADCSKRDELKIRALVSLYGKERVIAAIDNHRDFSEPESYFETGYSAYLPDVNYLLRFSASATGNGSGIADSLSFIKSQRFYEQLQ